ncbi:hypothetical protein HOV93_04840 [Planctomycetes bacterium FF15]|uniref:Uncharacterized protein n=1 Tax=Bremerella alba TaxID=980252 RepID=A0A7V8V1Q2_9BACT|nr:hypothetical protein [Bremerella alba]
MLGFMVSIVVHPGLRNGAHSGSMLCQLIPRAVCQCFGQLRAPSNPPDDPWLCHPR